MTSPANARPTPEQYTPPLTRWGHLWRYGLTALLSALIALDNADGMSTDQSWWLWIDVPLGAAAFVLVHFRRRWPMTIAVVTALLTFGSVIAAGPATLAAVSLATRRNVWQIVTVGVLGVIGAQVYFEAVQTANTDTRAQSLLVFGLGVVVTVAMMIWGMYIGSRRELLWTLRERAEQAEQRQSLLVERARSAERERIAREMHDVLAHRISLVTMHAGALAYRDDLPSAQVRETARLIQSKSHEALTDLRAVLGMLRGDDHDGRPQPTIQQLPSLISEARESGMVVSFEASIDPDADVPDQIGRTVYRIVQEGLTNARKHALDAHVHVALSGERGDHLEVSMRNGQALRSSGTPGAGLGIAGLRERAELAGGTLDVVSDRSGFLLRGSLPWPA